VKVTVEETQAYSSGKGPGRGGGQHAANKGRGSGGRGSGPNVRADGSFAIKVTTLKGQKFERFVTADMTILQLKALLCPHENESSVKIIVGSKMMANAKQDLTPTRLSDYHISAHKNELKLVSRFEGGAGGHREGIREVCHQLKWMTKESLGANFIGIEPLDDGWSWNVLLQGPNSSPFQNYVFEININFPGDYPSGAPTITFNTPIFHPNVYADGLLCWHESDTSGSRFYADIIFAAVLALLQSPNPSSPANVAAAHLFSTNQTEYRRQARAHAEKNAYSRN
jgi:ubiquitin-protein ligase